MAARQARFFGMVQLLSDPSPLVGRSIAYQRLMDSQLFQENEPLYAADQNQAAASAAAAEPAPRAHPKAPYLRLVTSKDSANLLHFGSGDLLQKMFDVIDRWRAANSQDTRRAWCDRPGVYGRGGIADEGELRSGRCAAVSLTAG